MRRTKTHTLARLLSLLAVLALLLAACGTDDDEPAADPADDDAEEVDEPEEDEEEAEVDEDEAEDEAEVDEDEAEEFFAGETIEVIVPFGPGGGTDTTARFIAPFMSDYIPGNPDIQIVNIEAPAGIGGSNEFVNRPSDGYHMKWSAGSTNFPYFLQDPAVQYDYRDMTPTVGVPTGGVMSVSPDTGYEEPADILDLSGEVVQGGQTATGLEAFWLIAWEMLEVDVDVVFGYEGRGPARTAFEQGEVDLDWQTTSAFFENVEPLIEEGEAIPMFSGGHLDPEGNMIRDPAFPDIPHIGEFYEEIHGEEPSGEAWDALTSLVPPAWSLQKILYFHDDAPEVAVNAVREAFIEMHESGDEFYAGSEEALGDYELMVGDDLVEAEALAVDVDEDTTNWVLDFMVENYDVEDPRE